jgi:uncharacterized membrane protein
MVDLLATALQPWADLFAESTWLSTALITLHVVAMFLAGGVAVGADRQLLITRSGEQASSALLPMLSATHGWVIAALAVTNLSGIALATADIATYAVSWAFWAKMGTLLLLLANGVRMRRIEAAAERDGEAEGALSPMPALRRSAQLSFAGWVVIVVLGVVISNG